MTEKDIIIIDLAHKGRQDCIDDIGDKDYVAGPPLWPIKILALEFIDMLRPAGLVLLRMSPITAFIAALAP